jgi:predicted metal-binding membrane protein
MNLAWIGAIALFVLLEKTIPDGRWLSRAAGVCLIAWGGWILVAAA